MDEVHERMRELGERHARAMEAGDVEAEVDALLGLAEEALRADDPGGAHMHAKIAEQRIGATGVARGRLSDALGLRGRSMRRRKQLDDALAMFERAEKAAAEHGARFEDARWIVHQAAVHLDAKDTAAAADDLDRARERLEIDAELELLMSLSDSRGDPRLEICCELEGQSGLLARALDDPDRAEDCYRKACDYARAGGDRAATAVWATNLGNACSRRRLYADADESYQAAMDAARETDDERGFVHAASQRAIALQNAHRNTRSADVLIGAAGAVHDDRPRLDLLDRAVSLLEADGEWQRVREVCEDLLARAAGLPVQDSARARWKTALQQARRVMEEPPPPIAEGPTALDVVIPRRMGAAVQRNDVLEMADVAHLVCDVKWGLDASNEAAWSDVLSDPFVRHRVFIDAVRALVIADMPAAALELSQRYKALGFALPALKRAEASAPAYFAAWRDLQAAVRRVHGAGQFDCYTDLERVREAGESLREAGELLRERDPVEAARLGVPVRNADLVDALPLDSPLGIVDLVVTGEGTVVQILRRYGDRVAQQPAILQAFGVEEAKTCLETYASHGIGKGIGPCQQEGLARLSKILHDRMLCPLAKLLVERGIVQVVLVPDLMLRHLPLHLAMVCGEEIEVPGVDTEGAEFFGELFPVEYASCLQAVCASQVFKRPRAMESVTALTDPRGDLPGARRTVAWLEQQVPDELEFADQRGAAATREALARGLDRSDLIVITAHGSFDDADPEESRLVLADGDWKLRELAERPPLGRNPLIALAACELGTTAVTTDDAVAGGFPGALVASGAATVLGAMWPIEDVSVGFFMERFLHHASHRGYRPSAALFRAVRDLRRTPRADVLARIDELMTELESEESPAADRAWVLLDNLRRHVDEGGEEHPFQSPLFWGALVIHGSGWHLPAGAQVGNAADMIEVTSIERSLAEIEGVLQKGRFDEARRKTEKLLPKVDGLQRARALSVLARCAGYGGGTWTRRSGQRQAIALARQARRLAEAEADEKLAAWLTGFLEEIEAQADEDA